MRVIAGSARGKRLQTPEGMDTRPTIDRVKEAVFSSLHFSLPGATVLDLFAGSGQMGIEALSRGAKWADFVDVSPKSVACIQGNLQLCDLVAQGKVHTRDFVSFLKGASTAYDVIFLDPPFDKKLWEQAFACIQERGLYHKETVVVCESEAGSVLPEEICGFKRSKSAKYGNIRMEYYRCGE